VPELLSGTPTLQTRAEHDESHTSAWREALAEVRRPGGLQRALGGADPRAGALGLSGLLSGSFSSGLSGFAIATVVADAITGADGSDQRDHQGSKAGDSETTGTRGGGTLLDHVLPAFDARASWAIPVAVPPDQVYACLRTADLARWGATRLLYGLRALPVLATAPREGWRRIWAELRPRHETLDDLLTRGFSLLEERPGEELVLGAVGAFWRARGELRPTDRAHFSAPTPPGTAKAAWGFAVSPRADGGTELRTEIRVLCADTASRRRFRVYWLLIRPGAGLIRREMLAAVRDAAEADQRDR